VFRGEHQGRSAFRVADLDRGTRRELSDDLDPAGARRRHERGVAPNVDRGWGRPGFQKRLDYLKINAKKRILAISSAMRKPRGLAKRACGVFAI